MRGCCGFQQIIQTHTPENARLSDARTLPATSARR
jgi:hypothetical protein